MAGSSDGARIGSSRAPRNQPRRGRRVRVRAQAVAKALVKTSRVLRLATSNEWPKARSRAPLAK